MDISVRKRSQVQVIQLRGDLRLGEAVDQFGRTAKELLDGGDNRVVVNLGEVRMIDSSGIGVLMRLLTSSRQLGGNTKLVNPSAFALKTLKLVGVLPLFEIYEEEEKAVESYS